MKIQWYGYSCFLRKYIYKKLEKPQEKNYINLKLFSCLIEEDDMNKNLFFMNYGFSGRYF